MLDVIVVGGGPVGSRVAYRLAGMGHSVKVVEKRCEAGRKPCCTGIISQDCVTAFEIPSKVILRQTHSARVFAPSGDSARLSRRETRVCIVDRQAFDRDLAERAREAGAEYSFDSSAVHLSFLPDRVGVTIRSREERPLEARFAVLATGFYSPLVKDLGSGLPGYYAVGAQTAVAVNGIEEVEIYLSQKLAPGFFGWLVPTSPGKALAGLLTHRSPGLKLRELMALLENQGKILPGERRIKYGGIPLKPLRRTWGSRWLLVGDAAGQVKPTTGGGLYFGLMCADIAAETLHNALTGAGLTAGRLSTYEKRWRKKLGRELTLEYLARRFYEHLNDRQITRIFERIKDDGIAASILQNDRVDFDRHGGILLKALGLGLKSEIKRVCRWPF